MCVVAGAGDCVGGNGRFDGVDLFGRERDVESGETFAELGAGASSDERNDGGALGENPCDGELGLA